MLPRAPGACAVAAFWLAASFASAQATVPGEAPAFTLRTSAKSSLLLSRAPDDPVLFPDRGSATSLWRIRLAPAVRISDTVTFDAAFEQRVRVFSSASGLAGADVLPSTAHAAYRLGQLDWRWASGSHAEWRGEIDRAALHVNRARANVTIGRQAIGWGRGVLFSAVDLFAPFTPLEADREWRRGVDAVRADVPLGDRASIDTAGAFADALDRSTFATRLRGYAGPADLEVVAGWRAGDRVVGVTSSAAVGDVELHGEVAWFRTPGTPGSIAFADPRTVVKAVGGGSYRVPAGNGVLMYAEYHYSGFGAVSPDRILVLLRDPAFQERYLRGDTQILARHATAVLAAYEVSPELTLSAQWLHSPADDSGVVVPSTTWTLSDRWSVLASGYLPYGTGPIGTTLGSAFGATPTSVFLQLRIYW